MRVPDHCVCKGHHSTFDDSWTRSYLPGVWEKFAGNVSISIINLSHMCAYSAILRLKIIINTYLSRRSNSARYQHLSKGGTEWDNPPHRFQTGWCCATVTNQSILPRILGMSDIYRWMVGPLLIHTYAHTYVYICLGRGLEITGKPFFSHFFISHSQHCLKMCVSCC